jgi:aminotransferase
MRPHIRDLIAKRESDLPKTEFEEILRIANESKDVISLGPGEPDFDTPKNIREATKRAIDRGLTHYSTTKGSHELREEISRKLKRFNKIDADPQDVIVTTGSSEALFLASLTLIEPGDKIIVPNPSYINYIPLTDMMQGKPVFMRLAVDDNFEYNIDSVKRKIDKKTHVLIINSPSNPTGRVLKRKNLEEIADVVMEHNMIVFSDEAYESFTYNGNDHVSIASLNGMGERVMSFFTFSKSYAMAGYRIGYATGPKEVVNAMSKLRLYSTISCSPFAQEAALEALRNSGGEVERMRKEYERRGKMIYDRLGEMDGLFKCNSPEGAFYLFPDIRSFGMSSVKFSHEVLNKAKVLVVPGTEFGEFGEGHVRMSYATSYGKIQEAMDRIEAWTKHAK